MLVTFFLYFGILNTSKGCNLKQIYRIEIPSQVEIEHVFKFWIGANLQLVGNLKQAVPCTHDEHVLVMERIDCVATAYSEVV